MKTDVAMGLDEGGRASPHLSHAMDFVEMTVLEKKQF